MPKAPPIRISENKHQHSVKRVTWRHIRDPTEQDKQTRWIGTPEALRGACPVWGGLGRNLHHKGARRFHSTPSTAWREGVASGTHDRLCTRQYGRPGREFAMGGMTAGRICGGLSRNSVPPWVSHGHVLPLCGTGTPCCSRGLTEGKWLLGLTPPRGRRGQAGTAKISRLLSESLERFPFFAGSF